MLPHPSGPFHRWPLHSRGKFLTSSYTFCFLIGLDFERRVACQAFRRQPRYLLPCKVGLNSKILTQNRHALAEQRDEYGVHCRQMSKNWPFQTIYILAIFHSATTLDSCETKVYHLAVQFIAKSRITYDLNHPETMDTLDRLTCDLHAKQFIPNDIQVRATNSRNIFLPILTIAKKCPLKRGFYTRRLTPFTKSSQRTKCLRQRLSSSTFFMHFTRRKGNIVLLPTQGRRLVRFECEGHARWGTQSLRTRRPFKSVVKDGSTCF